MPSVRPRPSGSSSAPDRGGVRDEAASALPRAHAVPRPARFGSEEIRPALDGWAEITASTEKEGTYRLREEARPAPAAPQVMRKWLASAFRDVDPSARSFSRRSRVRGRSRDMSSKPWRRRYGDHRWPARTGAPRCSATRGGRHLGVPPPTATYGLGVIARPAPSTTTRSSSSPAHARRPARGARPADPHFYATRRQARVSAREPQSHLPGALGVRAATTALRSACSTRLRRTLSSRCSGRARAARLVRRLSVSAQCRQRGDRE